MMSIFRKLFPLVVLLLLSSSLFAQTYRASLRGTINIIKEERSLPEHRSVSLTPPRVPQGRRSAVQTGSIQFRLSRPDRTGWKLSCRISRSGPSKWKCSVNQEQRRDITLSPAGPDLIETVYGPTTKTTPHPLALLSKTARWLACRSTAETFTS